MQRLALPGPNPLRDAGLSRLLIDLVPPPTQLPVVHDDPLLEDLVAFGDLPIVPSHLNGSEHQESDDLGGERAK